MQTMPHMPVNQKDEEEIQSLPTKGSQSHSMDTLCIDPIAPYMVKEPGKKQWKLHCLTMIDPAMGWGQ